MTNMKQQPQNKYQVQNDNPETTAPLPSAPLAEAGCLQHQPHPNPVTIRWIWNISQPTGLFCLREPEPKLSHAQAAVSGLILVSEPPWKVISLSTTSCSSSSFPSLVFFWNNHSKFHQITLKELINEKSISALSCSLETLLLPLPWLWFLPQHQPWLLIFLSISQTFPS